MIVKGAGLLDWSIGTSLSRGPQVGLPAQVQRSPPEALSVTRPQALAFDRHRPLEICKIVEAVIVRLVGALMLETNDEWTVARRYMSLETLARLIDNPDIRLPAVAS